MTDNLMAVLVSIALICFVLMLIYQLYMFLNGNHRVLDDEHIELEENEINAVKYFLNKVFTSPKELEQEKQFLLRFLERHSESLKQLGDTYEQLEIYIEFKLISIAEAKQERLRAHYQEIKLELTERFEALLNQHLSTKMMYSPYFEKHTKSKPISSDAINLNLSLFKLKKEKLKIAKSND